MPVDGFRDHAAAGDLPVDATDLLVIGGGINGAGIARDAAGRGLRVMLCEQGDLAGATSSASSKLIHGGLRYLEQYEFRLVREALAEREVLLRAAPHLIWPMRFVLPHDPSMRPAWMLRLGLFLYDHIGGRRSLPGTERLDLRRHRFGAPLKPEARLGFAYSDCWVDDARLVVLNARGAAARGAVIRTRTRVLSAARAEGGWDALIEDRRTGERRRVRARGLVNAAGPWVTGVIRDAGVTTTRGLRLVKGSHIVVPRVHDGDQAYILQNGDGRIVFVLPYLDRFTLIGTTDVPFDGDPSQVAISGDEIAYLCDAASRWLAKPVTPDQLAWSYAGVRALYDDHAASASTVTRDYLLELDAGAGGAPAAPLLSVFGGKITTFRRLAEQAMDRLEPFFPGCGRAWTRDATLPGGDLPDGDYTRFRLELGQRFPWMNARVLDRLARSYGTDVLAMLGDARRAGDLGSELGAGLTMRELDWLIQNEWALEPEDVLWRRTKLGLALDAAAVTRIRAAMAARLPAFGARHSA